MNNPTDFTVDLKDLLTMRELIEVCATRGVIHPKSFASIGTLWLKLDTIITNVNSTTPQTNPGLPQ
jgi:hypothetical protein